MAGFFDDGEQVEAQGAAVEAPDRGRLAPAYIPTLAKIPPPRDVARRLHAHGAVRLPRRAPGTARRQRLQRVDLFEHTCRPVL